jgi:hypothetical protein
MDLDPIVLLAYMSVAINLITLMAAAVAYALFRVRRQRQRSRPKAEHRPAATFEPAFLRPYRPDDASGSTPFAALQASAQA